MNPGQGKLTIREQSAFGRKLKRQNGKDAFHIFLEAFAFGNLTISTVAWRVSVPMHSGFAYCETGTNGTLSSFHTCIRLGILREQLVPDATCNLSTDTQQLPRRQSLHLDTVPRSSQYPCTMIGPLNE